MTIAFHLLNLSIMIGLGALVGYHLPRIKSLDRRQREFEKFVIGWFEQSTALARSGAKTDTNLLDMINNLRKIVDNSINQKCVQKVSDHEVRS